jgi:hypothetical protein
MMILLENHTIIHGMINYKKGSRAILYHPGTIEELLKEDRIISPRITDLLTNQTVYTNRSELDHLSKIGTLL